MSDETREPLSQLEGELARLQRALHADAEPGAALDGRILASARAAVVKPARRQRPWLVGAGFGAAAAAVLAAGVAWQMGWVDGFQDDSNHGVVRDRQEQPSASRGISETQRDSIQVEYLEQQPARQYENDQAVAPKPAPAASAPAAGRRESREVVERSRKQEAPVSKALPPAPQLVQSPNLDPDGLGPIAEPALPSAAAAPEPFPADAQTENQSAETEAPLDGTALDHVPSTSGAASAVGGAFSQKGKSLPPVEHDARLRPTKWLDRVRERRDAGDLAGARASLRRFVDEYPYLVVPDDLRPLLNP